VKVRLEFILFPIVIIITPSNLAIFWVILLLQQPVEDPHNDVMFVTRGGARYL
jgi:hypothetical protein